MTTSIPIIAFSELLLVTIQGDVSDEQLEALRAELCERIQVTRAKGVLMDISGLTLVDSYLSRTLVALTTQSRLLGATLVMVGMRPDVALTVVDMGLRLEGVNAVATLEQGQALLRRLALASGQEGGHGHHNT